MRGTANNASVGNASSMQLTQNGSGDAAISFLIGATTEWLAGVDNSDSDSFKISNITGGGDFTGTGITLTTSGNLGLGVTPTNNTLGKTLQVGQAGAWVAETGSNRWWLGSNWYYNSGDKYINNGFATLYSQQNGTHQWLISASGTAGNTATFTQAMTLDASGNLVVGDTSLGRRFKTRFDSNTVYSSSDFETTSLHYYINNASSTIGAYTGIQFGVGSNGDAAISAIRTGDGESALAFGTRGGGVRGERVRIDSSGNLGVGTTGQVSRISASGNSATDFKALTLRNLNGTANSTAVLNFEVSAGTEGDAASSAAQIKGVREGAGTNGALAFWTSLSGTPTERMRINSSGNLGLGVTPSATSSGVKSFEMQGVGSGLVSFGSVDTVVTAGAFYSSTGWKYSVSSSAVSYYYQSAGKHQWFNAASGTAGNALTATQAMTLSADGVLQVGRTSGSAGDGKLQTGATGTGAGATNTKLGFALIEDDSGNGAGLWLGAMTNQNTGVIGSRTASGNIAFQTYNGGWGERMRLTYQGNFLVGTTTVRYSGVVSVDYNSSVSGGMGINDTASGNGSTYIAFLSGGTFRGNITNVNNTSVAYNTTSDYRLKENIVPMTGALAKVAQLKPVTYKWISNGSDGQGFIAHELAEVVPDCVAGKKDDVDKDGNPRYQGVDTSFLVATLTAAIQEQQALITQLTARITALEGT